jgi:hypothetical protein
MQVTVESIENAPKMRVYFKCHIGKGVATWVGNTPARGKTYQVEFDIEEALRTGAGLILEKRERSPDIALTSDGMMEIAGDVRELLDQCTAVIGVGEDTITVHHDYPGLGVGTPVVLRTGDLLAYDVNV